MIYYTKSHLFLKNQQFITWSIRTDHGSYFKHKKRNKKIIKKQRRKRKRHK